MENRARIVILSLILICWNCFLAKSQLAFQIDSLSFSCYSDSKDDLSWENRVLYHYGPDIIIYGTLLNKGESSIILELMEMPESPNDSLTFHRDLQLFISYHNKKDYRFIQCPLDKTDIMSYPYLSRASFPSINANLDGRDYSYVVINAGESIPLAFETLSRPIDNAFEVGDIDSKNGTVYRKVVRAQKKAVKAIKSSIAVTPVINSIIDSSDICARLLEYADQLKETTAVYDYETSLPQPFLDKQPSFVNGGIVGFSKWFKTQIEASNSLLTGETRLIRVLFVVGKAGDIIYSKVIHDVSGETEDILASILQQSPKWVAGELHGEKVDSRVNMILTIDSNGEVRDLSIF